MSPRTSSQFEAIRQEKRQVILNTALELFAEYGFHATSMSMIAKKAGISKGLAYNYFESKNDILEEIVEHGFQEIGDLMAPDHLGDYTDEEVISFFGRSFDLVTKELRHWKLFYSLMLQPVVSEGFSKRYAKAAEPLFMMMHQFLLDNGSVDPEGDLMIISAMIEGAFLYVIVAPEIFPQEKMKEKIIDGIFRIIQTGSNK